MIWATYLICLQVVLATSLFSVSEARKHRDRDWNLIITQPNIGSDWETEMRNLVKWYVNTFQYPLTLSHQAPFREKPPKSEGVDIEHTNGVVYLSAIDKPDNEIGRKSDANYPKSALSKLLEPLTGFFLSKGEVEVVVPDSYVQSGTNVYSIDCKSPCVSSTLG